MIRLMGVLVTVGVFTNCANLESFSDEDCMNCELWNGDNRIEASQIRNEVLRNIADVTGLILYMDPNSLGEETVSLSHGKTLREIVERDDRLFCEDVRFVDQRLLEAPSCGGVLLTPNLLATAAHCIQYNVVIENDEVVSCENIQVGFGYELSADGSMPSELPRNDVYTCKSVEIWDPQSPTSDIYADFALIRLDRDVDGFKSEDISLTFQRPPNGTNISTLGFPMNLPMKLSSGETVEKHFTEKFLELFQGTSLENDQLIRNHENYFSDLVHNKAEVFKGNSGGPMMVNSSGVLLGNVSTAGMVSFRDFYPNGQPYWSPSSEIELILDNEQQCIKVVDCTDDDVICKNHGGAVVYADYKEQLEALGIVGIDL